MQIQSLTKAYIEGIYGEIDHSDQESDIVVEQNQPHGYYEVSSSSNSPNLSTRVVNMNSFHSDPSVMQLNRHLSHIFCEPVEHIQPFVDLKKSEDIIAEKEFGK